MGNDNNFMGNLSENFNNNQLNDSVENINSDQANKSFVDLNDNQSNDSYMNQNDNQLNKSFVNLNDDRLNGSYMNQNDNQPNNSFVNLNGNQLNDSYMNQNGNQSGNTFVNLNDKASNSLHMSQSGSQLNNTFVNLNDNKTNGSYMNSNDDIRNNLFGFDASNHNEMLNTAGDVENNTVNNTNMDTKKKKTPKKVFMSIACGILFGLFAGVSLYAVVEAASILGINSPFTSYMPTNSGPDLSNRVQTDTGEDVEVENESSSRAVLSTSQISTVVTDVTDVVEAVMPSIVSITNTFMYSSGFASQEVDAKGSGIIVGSNDEELLIVTNFHVIDGNDELKVTFCNEKEAPAEVKGTDSPMDLAVIAVSFDEIDSETLDSIKYASIGNSDNLKVGEPAIAIGNALGYGQSVTTGVISATNRQIDMNGDGNLRPFIQTDAAINEGNSGGALLNIAGELIGINSNKMGGTTVEGMGYAIPISSAEPKIEELMVRETRKVVPDDERGTLGISGATLNYQEILFYGYPEGVYVANVFKDSGAYNAGIREHDLISSFDGEKVTSMEQLQRILKYYRKGETVEVGVYKNTIRGYEEEIVTVTLGE